MPLYEFHCSACGRVFEAYTRLSDAGKGAACPSCGGASERIGISLFSARGSAETGKQGGSACGGGPRRSPFS